MKISKSYLKQIIKEELNNIVEATEGSWYDEVLVTMKASDFLNLTSDDEVKAKQLNLVESIAKTQRELEITKKEKVVDEYGNDNTEISIKLLQKQLNEQREQLAQVNKQAKDKNIKVIV